jgi:hypothetical protein
MFFKFYILIDVILRIIYQKLKLVIPVQIREGKTPTIFEEFDPGSGLTLAECLTHASRTDLAD